MRFGSYIQKRIKRVQEISSSDFRRQCELAVHPTGWIEIGERNFCLGKGDGHVLQLLNHDTLPLLNKWQHVL